MNVEDAEFGAVPGVYDVVFSDRVAPDPGGDVRLLLDASTPELGLPEVDEALADVDAMSAVAPSAADWGRALARHKPADPVDRLIRFRTPTDLPVEDIIGRLAERDDIELIEQVQYRVAFASTGLFDAEWALRAVGAPAAWGHSTGEAVTVAIIDSGVNAAHPAFDGRVQRGSSVVDVAGLPPPPGYHWEGQLTPAPNQVDDVGHGTHIAGVVGAAATPPEDVSGLAPSCTILPVRALARAVRTDGFVMALGFSSDVAVGINRAAKAEARVINVSWGGTHPSDIERLTIERLTSSGVAVVAAAGNTGQEHRFFPAAFPQVLAVSALDKDLDTAPYATTGAHVRLAAPGSDIRSTDVGGGYRDDSGSSIACAMVAATAALVMSRAPGLNAAAVVDRLIESAQPVAEGAPILDAAAAVEATAPL